MNLLKVARKLEKALGIAKGTSSFSLERNPTASKKLPWCLHVEVNGKTVTCEAAASPKRAVKAALRGFRVQPTEAEAEPQVAQVKSPKKPNGAHAQA